MEAATPLRQANVRTIGDRVVVDGLVVADEGAVRLVREREERGDDTVRAITDAIEIGARVLDREQAGANAEFVRSEFDKVSREVGPDDRHQLRQSLRARNRCLHARKLTTGAAIPQVEIDSRS